MLRFLLKIRPKSLGYSCVDKCVKIMLCIMYLYVFKTLLRIIKKQNYRETKKIYIFIVSYKLSKEREREEFFLIE